MEDLPHPHGDHDNANIETTKATTKSTEAADAAVSSTPSADASKTCWGIGSTKDDDDVGFGSIPEDDSHAAKVGDDVVAGDDCSVSCAIDIVFDDADDADDLSSVMSDVGLLFDIDFDDHDNTTSKFEHMVEVSSVLRRHHDTTSTDTSSTSGGIHNIQSTVMMNETDMDVNIDTNRRRPLIIEKKKNRKRRMALFESQLQELEKKFQDRQTYLQQIQPNRPKRLLRQIQERELLTSTLQRNQLVHEIKKVTSKISDNRSGTIEASTNLGHDEQQRNTHGCNSIYNFIVFEYYMTIPAGIAVLFHSIIMITIYDLVHELVLYTYTDILPALYQYTLWILPSLSFLSLPVLPSAVAGDILESVSQLLEIHYDSMFYIVMSLVGVYMIHLSGYLYWWLSDYDYTIMKLDVHNRIRLLQWRHHHITETDVIRSSTLTDESRIKEQQQQLLLSQRTRHHHHHDHQNMIRHQNCINSFVRRFYKVRQYPILRLTLYMIGYFILYMISQLIVSTTYPYFSQHKTILPHLPSATFDKRLYHLVKNDTIDGTCRNNNIFPCLEIDCREEMERQQQANHALIRAEQRYTKQRLAHMSYLGYWSTFVEQYGEKTVYPLFDTFRNRFYVVDDDEEDEEQDDDTEDGHERALGAMMKGAKDTESEQMRQHTGTIVDFHGTPVFNNTGEVVFGLVSLTIGIVLLRRYGFIFWEKY